jgi:hypothetical protein
LENQAVAWEWILDFRHNAFVKHGTFGGGDLYEVLWNFIKGRGFVNSSSRGVGITDPELERLDANPRFRQQ